MKKPNWPKFTSEIYREAGYSDEVVTNIEQWESQYPSAEALLKSYRYIQPDGELFSEHSLKIIIALHDMECMIAAQKELIFDIENNLRIFIECTFRKANQDTPRIEDHFFDGCQF